MSTIQPTGFLRRVLLADAFVCLAAAVLHLALTSALVSLLGLPAPLLVATGVFLVAYVALLVAMARGQHVWSWLFPLIVWGNVGWGVGCIALSLNGGWGGVPLTMLGHAYLWANALAVFVFAALEWRGWRAAPGSGAALRTA